jgi:hypothetical protein
MDERLRLQQLVLREMREQMNPAEWLVDFAWRILWPRHYAIQNYVHVSITAPIRPRVWSDEELVLLHSGIQRMTEPPSLEGETPSQRS